VSVKNPDPEGRIHTTTNIHMVPCGSLYQGAIGKGSVANMNKNSLKNLEISKMVRMRGHQSNKSHGSIKNETP
jgi:hypothetical protein